MLTLNIFEFLTVVSFFALLLGLAFAALWVWALIHALRSEFRSMEEKVLWVVVIILLPVVGIILYYFIGRKQTLQGGEL